MKTKAVTWFAFVLCIVTGFVWLGTKDTGQRLVKPTCPATDPALLRLPADHQAQAQAFAGKAQRLSASGRCVIEGSWGANYQRYYFAVYDVGTNPNRAYHVRFTAEDLSQ